MVIIFQSILFLSFIAIINLEQLYFISENGNKDNIKSLNAHYDFDINLETIITVLEYIKEDPTTLYSVIQDFGPKILDYINHFNISELNHILKDLFNVSSNSFINDTCELIKSNYSSINVLDYIINILKHIDENSGNLDKCNTSLIFGNLSQFFHYPGMDKIVNHFNNYKKIFYYILMIISEEKETYGFIFQNEELKDFLFKYNDILVDFCFNLIKAYNDTQKMANISYILYTENRNLIDDLDLVLTPELFQTIGNLIHIKNKYMNAIKNGIFKHLFSINIFFYFLNNTEILNSFYELLRHISNIDYC